MNPGKVWFIDQSVILLQADANHDGKLSKDEFIDMMLRFYNNYPKTKKWNTIWKSLAFADVYTW